jgi:hypothetical protein
VLKSSALSRSLLVLIVMIPGLALALVTPLKTGRFDSIAFSDPALAIRMVTVDADRLSSLDPVTAAGWAAFRGEQDPGGADLPRPPFGRSRAGPGPWDPVDRRIRTRSRRRGPVTVDSLAYGLRARARYPSAFLAKSAEMV